jgi:hypothetical protein
MLGAARKNDSGRAGLFQSFVRGTGVIFFKGFVRVPVGGWREQYAPSELAGSRVKMRCRFRKLHPPEWRLFPNQNMIPFDDRNRLPFRPRAVRLFQVATTA